MDVGPKDISESELSFTIDKPGYYLFRVETIDAVARRRRSRELRGPRRESALNCT